MNVRLHRRLTRNLITLHHVRPAVSGVSDKIHRTSEEDVNDSTIHANRFRKAITIRTGFASVWIWDEDETRLAEFAGSRTTDPHEAAKQAYIDAWGIFWHKQNTFYQNLKTQPGADPVLPRITVPIDTTVSAAPCSTNGHGCDLPGPQSQDDDEDSSPIVQELDRAEHTQCSSNNHSTLTHSLGASALGSEKSLQVTPASPLANAKLTNSTKNEEQQNAKLTTLVVGTDSKDWVTTGSTKLTPPNQLNSTQKNAYLTRVFKIWSELWKFGPNLMDATDEF